MPQTFLEKVQIHWQQKKYICVGLDPDYEKIPHYLKEAHASRAKVFFVFNKAIIDATAHLVCAYKPNSAFYEAEGLDGIQVLFQTVSYLRERYPDIPIILDAKRADIGNTNKAYAKAAFESLQADALTVNAYHGVEALEPFTSYKGKGVLVLIKTSNPEAKAVQDLTIANHIEPLYKVVARQVLETFGNNPNVGIVVGATYPKELEEVRAIVGDMPILIPGAGAQGGNAEAAIQAGKNSKHEGVILNFSRSILYASHGADFAERAKEELEKLHKQMSKNL